MWTNSYWVWLLSSFCSTWKHLSAKTARLNYWVEEWDTCNLSTNNLWINQTGFVYAVTFQPVSQTAQRNAEPGGDSLPHFISFQLQWWSQNINFGTFSSVFFTTYIDTHKHIVRTPKCWLRLPCEVSVQLCFMFPQKPAPPSPSSCICIHVYPFSRNSRMWMGRSTTPTCPPWPRRPPRAPRTFTSCRSPRCPCQSQSNLHDQVSFTC